jgi:putative PIN family toxin of toxin-antitoxin system
VRVFLDTNVIVSAVATRGLCADVMREVLAAHDLIVSPHVLTEVRRVLRVKFHASPEALADFLGMLEQEAIVARPGRPPDVKLEDKDDLPILGAAVAAKADVLVTGDRELVELGRVGSVPILSTREFWERLKTSGRRPPGA